MRQPGQLLVQTHTADCMHALDALCQRTMPMEMRHHCRLLPNVSHWQVASHCNLPVCMQCHLTSIQEDFRNTGSEPGRSGRTPQSSTGHACGSSVQRIHAGTASATGLTPIRPAVLLAHDN